MAGVEVKAGGRQVRCISGQQGHVTVTNVCAPDNRPAERDEAKTGRVDGRSRRFYSNHLRRPGSALDDRRDSQPQARAGHRGLDTIKQLNLSLADVD